MNKEHVVTPSRADKARAFCLVALKPQVTRSSVVPSFRFVLKILYLGDIITFSHVTCSRDFFYSDTKYCCLPGHFSREIHKDEGHESVTKLNFSTKQVQNMRLKLDSTST